MTIRDKREMMPARYLTDIDRTGDVEFSPTACKDHSIQPKYSDQNKRYISRKQLHRTVNRQKEEKKKKKIK